MNLFNSTNKIQSISNTSVKLKALRNLSKPPVIHKSIIQNGLVGLMLGAFAIGLTGCQTTGQFGTSPDVGMTPNSETAYPSVLEAFHISGKIGFTVPETANSTAQSASAFYVWSQTDDRFAMDITGAMGIGHTVIEYNGTRATLITEKTGEITADSPEELLLRATGWEAPISQLRYWISGRPAPSDDNSLIDEQGRLITSNNGNWVATFSYKNKGSLSHLPSKIKVQRNDGHKVIMTILHSLPQ